MRGFQLVHKDDLARILAGLLVASQATNDITDYQTGFEAAIMAISTAIGRQDDIKILLRERVVKSG